MEILDKRSYTAMSEADLDLRSSSQFSGVSKPSGRGLTPRSLKSGR